MFVDEVSHLGHIILTYNINDKQGKEVFCSLLCHKMLFDKVLLPIKWKKSFP